MNEILHKVTMRQSDWQLQHTELSLRRHKCLNLVSQNENVFTETSEFRGISKGLTFNQLSTMTKSQHRKGQQVIKCALMRE